MSAARAAGRQIVDQDPRPIGFPRTLVKSNETSRAVWRFASLRSSIETVRTGNSARCAAMASSVHAASGTSRTDAEVFGTSMCNGFGDSVINC